MNEKPDGTPNPLNPNPLDANPSDVLEEIDEVQVFDSVRNEPIEPKQTQMPSNEDFGRPREPRQVSEEIAAESVMVESLDPNGRPMEKVGPATEKPKGKKKTGLIVALVICLLVAIGCGTAAAIMLLKTNSDPVAAAMEKLMGGNLPANVGIDGTVKYTFDNESPISRVDINLDVKAKTKSMINTVSTDAAIVLANNEQVNFSFDEMYAANGDLFLKIDGGSDLIEKLTLLSYPDVIDCIMNDEDGCLEVVATDCTASGDCEVIDALIDETGEDLDVFNDMFGGIIAIILDKIDGEWLKLSTDELEMFSERMTEGGSLGCVMNFVNDINTNSNSAAELYNKNPFVTSTDENITVSSKLTPVRKIVIDDKAFLNYVNSINNSSMSSTLYDCLGWKNNVSVSASDVQEMLAELPAVYVETDAANNFTRVMFSAEAEDNNSNVVVDLDISYPVNVNVSEPAEYVEFMDVFQEIMMSFGVEPEQSI